MKQRLGLKSRVETNTSFTTKMGIIVKCVSGYKVRGEPIRFGASFQTNDCHASDTAGLDSTPISSAMKAIASSSIT